MTNRTDIDPRALRAADRIVRSTGLPAADEVEALRIIRHEYAPQTAALAKAREALVEMGEFYIDVNSPYTDDEERRAVALYDAALAAIDALD